MGYLYKNWAYMCLPLAIYTSLILCSCATAIDPIVLCIWLQFPVYLLHQFEEHAKPGGFKQFINREIFKITDQDMPMNDANIFWINIPVIWIFFPLCAVLAQNFNIAIGVALPYIGLFNASIHILTFLLKRQYNPGFLVSLFLNYPTGIYLLLKMHQQQLLTSEIHAYGFLTAVLIHVMIIVYAVRRHKKFKATL